MAKKVSTTVLGGFVVSAIVMLMAAVVLLGSGSFWAKTHSYVLYFEESVKGLNVGSPVMFRGVAIGTVKSIVLQAEQETLTVNIQVTIEINEDSFQLPKAERHDIDKHFDRLIELGLRGQLDMQSIVTGQLLIQLDFMPDTPVKFSSLENKYPEIPTVRSAIDKLANTFRKMPVKQIMNDLSYITHNFRELLSNGKVDHILENIDSAVAGADTLVTDTNAMILNVGSKIDSFSEESVNTIREALKLFKEAIDSFIQVTNIADRTIMDVDREIKPVADGLIKTLEVAQKAISQAESTLVTVDDFIDHSDTRAKLNRSLDEITSAARALGELADYLERHPEALLKGK